MEEETFLPKSKAYVFRGFELVFTYKYCNKPSVNLMLESIAVKSLHDYGPQLYMWLKANI